MPSVLLSDTISMTIEDQEPWPALIRLFQPYEVEQILLPDNANCLAVQAFLKMCELEFQVEPRSNAEFMSPTGRVPFIQCGKFCVSEFDNIVAFISNKSCSLSEQLDEVDQADMRAYKSLVHNVFYNAEQYFCWVDPVILNNVTKVRHGSVYPWPLNHFMNWRKQSQVKKKLNVHGWYNKSQDEVLNDVRQCCIALTQKLSKNDYFFGDKPTELDALIYGHVHALTSLHFSQLIPELSMLICQSSQLMNLKHKIDRIYFAQETPEQEVEDFEII